jgi:uncharacterized protein
MVRLELLNVGLVEETEAVLLVLRAPDAEQLLVVQTGLLEGEAVYLEAEGVKADRPLTQDLLHEAILALGGRVKEVQIREFQDEAFHARVILTRPDGGGQGTNPEVAGKRGQASLRVCSAEYQIELDARPSDAVALALRAHAPMYADEELLAAMGLPEDPRGRFGSLYADDDHPRLIH